jgi:hypothetical protein
MDLAEALGRGVPGRERRKRCGREKSGPKKDSGDPA